MDRIPQDSCRNLWGTVKTSELPPNPSNLDAESDHLELLDTSPSPPPAVPVTPPPGPRLGPPAMPHPVWTRSQESSQTEKRRLFEQKIEAERDYLVRVREVAARRGGESTSGLGRNEGEGDESEGASEDDEENSFVGGRFENAASLAMAASLDTEDYLQWDVDSLCKATLLSICSDIRRNPLMEGYDMKIPPVTHWEAERRTDAEEW